MSMKDKSIRIQDWAGNILFIGPYDDDKVDEVLAANRCTSHSEENFDIDFCPQCNGTGYYGDFSVAWIDEQNDADGMNVYEYINY